MGEQPGTGSVQLLHMSLLIPPQGAKRKGLLTAPGGRSIHEDVVCIRGEAEKGERDVPSAD